MLSLCFMINQTAWAKARVVHPDESRSTEVSKNDLQVEEDRLVAACNLVRSSINEIIDNLRAAQEDHTTIDDPDELETKAQVFDDACGNAVNKIAASKNRIPEDGSINVNLYCWNLFGESITTVANHAGTINNGGLEYLSGNIEYAEAASKKVRKQILTLRRGPSACVSSD